MLLSSFHKIALRNRASRGQQTIQQTYPIRSDNMLDEPQILEVATPNAGRYFRALEQSPKNSDVFLQGRMVKSSVFSDIS